uniref:Transmembrane protein n=1 Tax=Chromera velia CCMP2878 TaxID=1169474 RepID=A0A0G4HN10_9ALVE|eukprot:Cvel_1192.t1-p1 / transcript=Cvel_1192.t1 / gene=Cvel_1192 / organism=Chromera_velia_CCMP2878 / gene_product=hypothetical protein / transcript_product=hypothetical protein / location=Cvel_scaffold39:143377-146415(-) / protein_length=394 / sequence_SO=supercontig / SO=protein_coding / is_pseudo=false
MPSSESLPAEEVAEELSKPSSLNAEVEDEYRRVPRSTLFAQEYGEIVSVGHQGDDEEEEGEAPLQYRGLNEGLRRLFTEEEPTAQEPEEEKVEEWSSSTNDRHAMPIPPLPMTSSAAFPRLSGETSSVQVQEERATEKDPPNHSSSDPKRDPSSSVTLSTGSFPREEEKQRDSAGLPADSLFALPSKPGRGHNVSVGVQRTAKERVPMALVAPVDASREGTLPVRTRFCLMSCPLLCWSFSKETQARAKVPRLDVVPLYLRSRQREVWVQRLIATLCVCLLLLLLCLFIIVSESGEEIFPIRHKQYALREYLVCTLYTFCFAIGFPLLVGLCNGLLVWMSCRTAAFDWLINLCPLILRFPETSKKRHVTPGLDVVKILDASPSADWEVPRCTLP